MKSKTKKLIFINDVERGRTKIKFLDFRAEELKITRKSIPRLIVFIASFVFVFLLLTNTVLAEVKLDNPLGEKVADPRAIIGNVINAVLGLVGSFALLMFIWGGFTWVTSGGNDEKKKKGKDMIVWASLGLVVVFFAFVMVRFVITAITGPVAPAAGGDDKSGVVDVEGGVVDVEGE